MRHLPPPPASAPPKPFILYCTRYYYCTVCFESSYPAGALFWQLGIPLSTFVEVVVVVGRPGAQLEPAVFHMVVGMGGGEGEVRGNRLFRSCCVDIQ